MTTPTLQMIWTTLSIPDSSVDCYGVCKCGDGAVLDGSDCDCPQRKGFNLFLEAFYNA